MSLDSIHRYHKQTQHLLANELTQALQAVQEQEDVLRALEGSCATAEEQHRRALQNGTLASTMQTALELSAQYQRQKQGAMSELQRRQAHAEQCLERMQQARTETKKLDTLLRHKLQQKARLDARQEQSALDDVAAQRHLRGQKGLWL